CTPRIPPHLVASPHFFFPSEAAQGKALEAVTGLDLSHDVPSAAVPRSRMSRQVCVQVQSSRRFASKGVAEPAPPSGCSGAARWSDGSRLTQPGRRSHLFRTSESAERD